MLVFLGIVAGGCVLMLDDLARAFVANTWFNGVILAVLAVGIVINFRQVVSLYPEIQWIEDFQDDLRDDDAGPRLLASMARMLRGHGDKTLSPTSLRTILDSIQTRLEESRDLSRYLIGVLIFLGLLGTFWGLMATVGSVGEIIGGMSVESSDGAVIFERLKANLREPLGAMGVAFFSSLFGLAGSLVLGFLDLQAGHAQNRFVNELEEWLASSTRLSSGILGDEGAMGAPAYVQALLEKVADTLERMQRASHGDDTRRGQAAAQLRDLELALGKFNDGLRNQNEQLGRLAENQGELARALSRTLDDGDRAGFSEELRAELRLLNKTIANALTARGGE